MESDEVKIFRVNLRRLCSVRGTARRICRGSGVSTGYLYKVMNGDSVPSIDIAARVSRAAGVRIQEMFSEMEAENISGPG